MLNAPQAADGLARAGLSPQTAAPGNQTAAAGDSPQALIPEARERGRRRRRTGAAVAAALAAAVAVAAVIWRPWDGGARAGQPEAPGVALAGRPTGPVGQASISWSVRVGPWPRARGTEHISFSGRDRSLDFTRTDYPNGPDQGGTQAGVERIVRGQDFVRFRRHGQLAWFRERLSGYAVPKIIDPRILFRLLSARTPFRADGTQVIDGQRLRVLTATDPFGLTRRDLLPVMWTSPEPVNSLRVWVDSHGVVRRMTYTFRYYPAKILPAKPVSKAALRRYQQAERAFDRALDRAGRYFKRTGKQAPGRWERLAYLRAQLWLEMAYPPRPGAEVTTTTITFSGIGQPQHIIAPPDPVTGP